MSAQKLILLVFLARQLLDQIKYVETTGTNKVFFINIYYSLILITRAEIFINRSTFVPSKAVRIHL